MKIRQNDGAKAGIRAEAERRGMMWKKYVEKFGKMPIKTAKLIAVGF